MTTLDRVINPPDPVSPFGPPMGAEDEPEEEPEEEEEEPAEEPAEDPAAELRAELAAERLTVRARERQVLIAGEQLCDAQRELCNSVVAAKAAADAAAAELRAKAAEADDVASRLAVAQGECDAQAAALEVAERTAEAATLAALAWLGDAARRAVQLEGEAVGKACRKPNFLSELERTYERQAERFDAMLAGPSEVWGTLAGVDWRATLTAATACHLDESKGRLLDLSGTVTASGLAEAVEGELSGWSARADRLVAELTEKAQ
jgi:hypothetical protein